MRDALSILDQAISYGDDSVTAENAMSVTGSLTQELVLDYFDAIIQHKTEKGLSLLQSILAEGKDASRFVEDLILFSRDLLVYQQAPQMTDLLEGANVDEGFKTLSQTITAQQLYEVIGILNDTQQEMRFTNHAEVYLEVATVKLTQLTVAKVADRLAVEESGTNGNSQVGQQKITDMEKELLQMRKQLQELAKNGGAPQPTKKAPKAISKPGNNQFKTNTTIIYKVLSEATKDNLAQLVDIWPDLLNMLSVTQRAIMKASTPVAASPNGLIVSFEYDILCQKATNDQELLEAVSEDLRRLVGYSPQMICVPAEQWPVIREQFLKQNKELIKKRPAEKVTTPSVHKNETQVVSNYEQENLASLESVLPEPEEDETIVTEAMELFGEAVVEVRND